MHTNMNQYCKYEKSGNKVEDEEVVVSQLFENKSNQRQSFEFRDVI